jgi:Cell wall-active antibiotics response 4TMS YvqF
VNEPIAEWSDRTVGHAVPAGEMRVLGLLNTVRRTRQERWPARVVVRAFLSDVTLDLRDASLPPTCTIDISAWFANVLIIVPPDVHVDFDIFTMIGDASDSRKKRALPTAPDAPRVSIVGAAHVAGVQLRVKALQQR